MMKKGVTGKVLTVIISMIMAIIALALLWFFLSQSTNIIAESVQKIIANLRCKLFCGGLLGAIGKIGNMCSGC